MSAHSQSELSNARQGIIPVENGGLYYRAIGEGQPILILHGGPDFDHTYLLPDLDRLSDSFRLIYYDQRGRGKSAENVTPGEVTIQSDCEDVEKVRQYFRLETAAVMGHSWGGLLAMEYTLRHPERVSCLILMNTAPVSHTDYLLLRQERIKHAAADVEELKARKATASYQEGDPEAVAAYYRIHFRTTLRKPELLERLVQRLRLSFTKDGILKARAIEDRLMQETWLSSTYDLLPRLKQLRIPALIIHGEYDLIPVACAAHIAQAIPGSRFVVLQDCGHFAYLERPERVRKEIDDFYQGDGNL